LSNVGAPCNLSFSTFATNVGWLLELLLFGEVEELLELLLLDELLEFALRSFQGRAMTLSPDPTELLEMTANSTRPDWGLRITS